MTEPLGPILAGLVAASAWGAAGPSWSDGRATGLNGPCRALLAVESASIPSGLYVAGDLSAIGATGTSRVARWDGRFWSLFPTGPNAEVRSLILFDPDGPGAAPDQLIAAGAFSDVGVPASRIAAWDGSTWSPLGLGVNGRVNSMCVFDDDGPGASPPALYVAGSFALAGGNPALNLARWDGASWSPAADTGNEALLVASVDPDGPGPDPVSLVAGGWFTTIAGVEARFLARRIGAEWMPFGNGFDGPFPVFAQTIAEFDPDAGGPLPVRLYAGGFFTSAGGLDARGLASWDGSVWADVAGGIGHPAEARAALVHDDDGPGPNSPRLFVAGNFTEEVGGPGRRVSAWDGSAWTPLGGGAEQIVHALAVFDDDGAGPDPPALFAGGEFHEVDGAAVLYLARWGTPRTAPPPCPDANGDGAVNFADITAVLQHFGETCPPGARGCEGDADGNGAVSFADVTAVLTGFGAGCE